MHTTVHYYIPGKAHSCIFKSRRTVHVGKSEAQLTLHTLVLGHFTFLYMQKRSYFAVWERHSNHSNCIPQKAITTTQTNKIRIFRLCFFLFALEQQFVIRECLERLWPIEKHSDIINFQEFMLQVPKRDTLTWGEVSICSQDLCNKAISSTGYVLHKLMCFILLYLCSLLL